MGVETKTNMIAKYLLIEFLWDWDVIKSLHLIEINFLDPIEEVGVLPSVNHYSAMTYIEKYALFQLMVEQTNLFKFLFKKISFDLTVNI